LDFSNGLGTKNENSKLNNDLVDQDNNESNGSSREQQNQMNYFNKNGHQVVKD